MIIIKWLKQLFCNHKFEISICYGIDKDLYERCGIAREVPLVSNEICYKCHKTQRYTPPKTFIYFTNTGD